MKVNYLNNKDLLEEIHRSKNSFSSYTQPEYHQYDIILPSIEAILDFRLESHSFSIQNPKSKIINNRRYV